MSEYVSADDVPAPRCCMHYAPLPQRRSLPARRVPYRADLHEVAVDGIEDVVPRPRQGRRREPVPSPPLVYQPNLRVSPRGELDTIHARRSPAMTSAAGMPLPALNSSSDASSAA